MDGHASCVMAFRQFVKDFAMKSRSSSCHVAFAVALILSTLSPSRARADDPVWLNTFLREVDEQGVGGYLSAKLKEKARETFPTLAGKYDRLATAGEGVYSIQKSNMAHVATSMQRFSVDPQSDEDFYERDAEVWRGNRENATGLSEGVLRSHLPESINKLWDAADHIRENVEWNQRKGAAVIAWAEEKVAALKASLTGSAPPTYASPGKVAPQTAPEDSLEAELNSLVDSQLNDFDSKFNNSMTARLERLQQDMVRAQVNPEQLNSIAKSQGLSVSDILQQVRALRLIAGSGKNAAALGCAEGLLRGTAPAECQRWAAKRTAHTEKAPVPVSPADQALFGEGSSRPNVVYHPVTPSLVQSGPEKRNETVPAYDYAGYQQCLNQTPTCASCCTDCWLRECKLKYKIPW